METDNFIRKVFRQNGRNLENKIRDIFMQCSVFNETIIPLTLVGYEIIIADSALRTSSSNACSWNNC